MLDQRRERRIATDVDIRWIEGRGVSTAPWPADGPSVDGGAPPHLPRPLLYLVEPGVEAPRCGELEDWVRKPLDRGELLARADSLLARSKRIAAQLTVVDESGVLRVGDALVILTPFEAQLVRPLVERLGEVVPREVLIAAAWPDGAASEHRMLDNGVKRVRSRIATLPLALHTIRGRGLLLERLAEPDAPHPLG